MSRRRLELAERAVDWWMSHYNSLASEYASLRVECDKLRQTIHEVEREVAVPDPMAARVRVILHRLKESDGR